jgi:A nuclease family of the HNH/ENDO VII superfamily with conserved AHH/Pretoxin HINT domain
VKIKGKGDELITLSPNASELDNAAKILIAEGLGCFSGETKIITSTGLRRIDSLQGEELVWSRDEASGAEGWQRVEMVKQTPPIAISGLDCLLPDGQVHRIRGTHGHPIWSLKHGSFVGLGELLPGDHLLLAQDQGYATVIAVHTLSVTEGGARQPTYNLTVANWHTYFVAVGEAATGKTGPPAAVWVHNTIGGDCPGVLKLNELVRNGASVDNALNAVKAAADSAQEVWTSSGGSLKGNSSKLREAIGTPAGYQAHHLVPSSVGPTRDLFKEAARRGYDINGKSNGLSLPKDLGESFRVSLPVHNGGHTDTYYDFVEDLIETEERKFGPALTNALANASDAEIKQAVNAIENAIRGALVTGAVRTQRVGNGWPR